MLEISRVFEILYGIDERDLVAGIAADLGDNATDAAALATLASIAARHHDARTTLLIGKGALRRGLPFERYAFPDFGVPDYRQIGPEVEPCVVYAIIRQESAFNPRVVSSANAIGLMQVTPAAGRDTAKRFNVTFDQRRLSQDVAYNAQLARLLHSGLRCLQCRPAPRQRVGRAIRRSAQSEDRSNRLDRADSDFRDAQLRPARAREYAGVSRARAKQSEAFDRGRSTAGRVIADKIVAIKRVSR